MKLKDLLENIKNDDMGFYKKVSNLIRIANDFGLDSAEQIVTDEQINKIIKDYLEDWNSWQLIAIFLADVELISEPYYYLNRYGNLEKLITKYIL